MSAVWFDEKEVPLIVERSARAKRTRIRIDRTNRRAVLVLSKRASERAGLAFAQSKADWIVRELNALPAPKVFADSFSFDFLGEPVVIRHSPKSRRGVWKTDGVIWVSGEAEFLPRRVADFLKREFQSYAQKKILELAAALQVKVSRITIRDTTSRWGSCTRDGHISLSWRLCFAPPSAADYVIAHEVSHLKQMNHSPAFWATVAMICPTYKKEESWLKRNAAFLYSFTV